MKIVLEVPLANRQGKTLKLDYDRESGELGIETPVMFGTPVVRLTELESAIDELRAHRAGAGRGST